MKKTISGIMFCLAALAATSTALPASAQNEIKIENITAVNVGDGRILFRQLESEEPLNGSHRLIDGIRSEYILAEFTNGFYNGSYEHHRNNALIEKGSYKEGVPHGLFTRYYSDGKTVAEERTVSEGKVDGVVKNYRTDGSLEKEKGYKAGKEHGPERYWERGSDKPRIDRNYFEGVPDGRQYAEISSNTGDYVEVAYFDKGTPTGEFLQTWANGDVKARGSYKDGKKHGVWEETRRDGKKESEITYADGKRNGESKSFFTDNSVEKITTYVDDKREGVEKTFRFESGLIATEYTYKAGIRDGVYKTYYDDEKPTLREEGRYERDTQAYYKEYYGSGQLRRIRQRNNKGSWETLEEYSWDGTRREL